MCRNPLWAVDSAFFWLRKALYSDFIYTFSILQLNRLTLSSLCDVFDAVLALPCEEGALFSLCFCGDLVSMCVTNGRFELQRRWIWGKGGPFAVLDTAYLINSNTELIHLCRRKLIEVWVALWRHMVEFQDCRQTRSADLLRGKTEMALLGIHVCLQCCARFLYRTLNCPSLLTWRRELSFQKGKIKHFSCKLLWAKHTSTC